MIFYLNFDREVVHIWKFKYTKFGVISIPFRYSNNAPKMTLQIWKILISVQNSAYFKLLYLDAQNSEFSSVCFVWTLVWISYCVTKFKGGFTFCALCRKDCWKTKTGSNLSSWNWNFELKNEYCPFRILEKCLLGTFSTSNLVSDGIKFAIFGHAELKIWFFKNCHAKQKFSDFLGNEFLRTCHSLSISIDHFKLDFIEEASLSLDFKSSLLNLDFREI